MPQLWCIFQFGYRCSKSFFQHLQWKRLFGRKVWPVSGQRELSFWQLQRQAKYNLNFYPCEAMNINSHWHELSLGLGTIDGKLSGQGVLIDLWFFFLHYKRFIYLGILTKIPHLNVWFFKYASNSYKHFFSFIIIIHLFYLHTFAFYSLYNYAQ